jgi:hypothetical protein
MQNQTSFFVSTQRNDPTMISLVKTEFKELKKQINVSVSIVDA